MLAPQKTSSTTQETEQQSAQTSYGVDNRPSTARQLTIQRMMNNGGASTTKTFNGPKFDPTELEGASGSTNDNDDPYYVDENALNEEWGEQEEQEEHEEGQEPGEQLDEQEQGEQLDDQDEAVQGEQEHIANSVPDWEDWSELVKKNTKVLEATEESTGKKNSSLTINYNAAITQYLIHLEAWYAHYNTPNAEIDKNQWVETESELSEISKLPISEKSDNTLEITEQQSEKAKYYHKWVKDIIEDKGFVKVETKSRLKETEMEENRKKRAAQDAQEKAEKLKRDAEFRAKNNPQH